MSTNPGNWQHSEEYSRAAESFLPVLDADAPRGLDGQSVRGQAASPKRVAWPASGGVAGAGCDAAAESVDGFDTVTASSPGSVPANRSEPLAAKVFRLAAAAWWRVWAKIEVRRAEHGRRSLRVVETIALGEKRFMSIVQVEGARFLIGGGSAGVSLLARLDAAQPFAVVLEEQAAPSHSVAATRIREAW